MKYVITYDPKKPGVVLGYMRVLDDFSGTILNNDNVTAVSSLKGIDIPWLKEEITHSLGLTATHWDKLKNLTATVTP